MTISGHLLLVGCGKMGGAMLRGWLQRGVRPGDVTVVEPNPAAWPTWRRRASGSSTTQPSCPPT